MEVSTSNTIITVFFKELTLSACSFALFILHKYDFKLFLCPIVSLSLEDGSQNQNMDLSQAIIFSKST